MFRSILKAEKELRALIAEIDSHAFHEDIGDYTERLGAIADDLNSSHEVEEPITKPLEERIVLVTRDTVAESSTQIRSLLQMTLDRYALNPTQFYQALGAIIAAHTAVSADMMKRYPGWDLDTSEATDLVAHGLFHFAPYFSKVISAQETP